MKYGVEKLRGLISVEMEWRDGGGWGRMEEETASFTWEAIESIDFIANKSQTSLGFLGEDWMVDWRWSMAEGGMEREATFI